MINFFKKLFSQTRNVLIIYSVIVLAASYFTYFKNYDYPPSVFWDENYHIASAEKYLQNVMFMEPHPPLGKLFVALGEYIIHPNDGINKSGFTQTDYIKDFPAGYSFKGVRFFSALFAWLSAIVFFYILYFISKNPHTSLIFSSLYVFENALITHSRAAMLEGSHLFFILLAVLYFVYLVQKKSKITFLNYLIFGALAGLAVSIKATGAIVFFLFPFLFILDQKQKGAEKKLERNSSTFLFSNYLNVSKKIATKGLFFAIGFVAVFSLIWQIHFSLGKIVLNDKYYKGSENYKELIKNVETDKFKNFPVMFKDNMAYMANYNKGVPKLDVCKPDENGSYPLAWLVGDKSINYRWEKSNEGVRYMYLQVNPITWFLGLAGIILSLVLIIGRAVFKNPVKNNPPAGGLFYLITAFATLYLIYMAIMLKIERVMYLYHYFIPLVFSFILAFLVFNYIFEEKITNKSKMIFLSLAIMVIAIIGTYKFFSPLSYYQPLTAEQFEKRIWFDFWKLKPIN